MTVHCKASVTRNNKNSAGSHLMDDSGDAYILHVRSFSDSKILIEFLSRAFGRLKVVARVPSRKNRAQYQTFQPLTISVRGHSELKTLTQCEVLPNRLKCLDLSGESLFCGMYINELVQRLTPLEEPDHALFYGYEAALLELSQTGNMRDREVVLRCFELELLSTLGYQIDFSETTEGERLDVRRFYQFAAGNGFCEVPAGPLNALSGEAIMAVGRREFMTSTALQAAKQVTRAALKPLLGQRPIKSRELFR